jgi:replicative DNA helicase
LIQLQVLNYILKTKDSSLLLVNNINKEFFSDYTNEYEYIINHLKTYGNIPDETSFLSKFPNFDLIEVNESPSYLIDKLYEDKNTRSLASIFNEIKDNLMSNNLDKAMDIYLNSTETMLKARHIDSVDILRNTDRYEAYLERCDNFDKYYVRTGFKELDDIIGGWDREEELATIVARSNQGKSWVLFKCAVAAVEQGLRVGLYSGEMSERKVGYRVDTLISNISNSAIIKGDRSVQNVYKKYLDDLPNRYTGCLKVLTPNMIDGPAGVNSLRAFIERDNLDILFIDQHSLLEDDRHARAPFEKAANISKDLKNLQMLKKIPIVSVSQQNRNSTENGVGLEHVAQSDRIAQDSTIVLFFEQKDGIMTMHLVKSRDSVNMKDLKYNINLNTGTFIYIPEDDNAVNGEGVEDLRKTFEEELEEDVF